jgi:hypothetical protein
MLVGGRDNSWTLGSCDYSGGPVSLGLIWTYFYTVDSVSDPYFIEPDPDPAFQAEYRSGYRVLMAKTCKTFSLSQGRPSYRRNLQPSKENIQYVKTWIFLIISIFVGDFCPPGSGSELQIGNTASRHRQCRAYGMIYSVPCSTLEVIQGKKENLIRSTMNMTSSKFESAQTGQFFGDV